MDASLTPFFLALFASVIFSEFFRRLHLPWVVALMVGGMVLGPDALGWVPINETMLFFAEVGLIFLMFMAGLETKINHSMAELKGITIVALVNALIPLGVGYLIGHLLGLGWVASLLVGIIFMSSSVAVVVPALEAKEMLHNRLGRFIISSTVIQDVLSLIVLSVLFQALGFGVGIPIVPLYGLVVLVFLALRWLVPKVNRSFVQGLHFDKATKDLFQKEIRLVMVILIGVVILFEVLGLHPIVGAFLAGLILSDSVSSEHLYGKLRAVSYGIFIPIFFIMVGARTDLNVLLAIGGAGLLALIILLASVSSKYASGYLGGRLAGLNASESHMIGITSLPQLSTTLAVAFIGFERQLLSADMVAALVLLSVVTTLLGPFLVGNTSKVDVMLHRFGRQNDKLASVDDPPDQRDAYQHNQRKHHKQPTKWKPGNKQKS